LAGVKGEVNAVSGLGVMFSGEKMGMMAKGVLSIMRFSHHRKGVKIIFQNQEDREMFCRHGVVDESQCNFIKGSGVDLNEFRYVPEQESDKLKVVFSARMVKEKGVIELIEAAELLRNDY
jgi:glycosyltransferase involved in cell wall biosynthesis